MAFINYLPFAVDTDAFRSNLGITNISSAEANVQIELRDSDGNLLASGATKIPARGLKQLNSVNRLLLNAETVTNTTGAVRITSDQPFSSFISVIDNSSNDPGLQVGRNTGFARLLINSATNTETGEVLATKEGIFIEQNGFFISDDIFAEMGIESNFGPLEIESPNLQPLIGVALIGSSNGTSGFMEAVPIQ
ncbi:MAG: hypothetical protein L0312_00475 [Acidobacteria bacterium]|nr:hypothetical protein [Acidobacteriota bacterium]